MGNEKKKKKKKLNSKKVHEQNVFFFILRMYTKFHKNWSINKKVNSETRWSP